MLMLFTQMVSWEGEVIRSMRLWSKQKSSVLDILGFFTLMSGLWETATRRVPADSKRFKLKYTFGDDG